MNQRLAAYDYPVQFNNLGIDIWTLMPDQLTHMLKVRDQATNASMILKC